MQNRDRRAFFRKTALQELLFDFGELGFEEVLIAFDIPQMGTQTGDALVHSHALENGLILRNVQLIRENYSQIRAVVKYHSSESGLGFHLMPYARRPGHPGQIFHRIGIAALLNECHVIGA